MGRRELMKKRFDRLVLPTERPDMTRPPESYDGRYIPAMVQLGIKSKGDVKLVIQIIEELTQKMSDEVHAQNKKDLEAGKIKDLSEAPLYKSGGIIHNIPDSFTPYLAFEIWLSKRGEVLAETVKEESAMKKSNDGIELSREMYKKIRAMTCDQLQSFLTAVYADGKCSAAPAPVEEAPAAKVDLGHLREEIGTVKGIGENRLNEIMTVIEKTLS